MHLKESITEFCGNGLARLDRCILYIGQNKITISNSFKILLKLSPLWIPNGIVLLLSNTSNTLCVNQWVCYQVFTCSLWINYSLLIKHIGVLLEFGKVIHIARICISTSFFMVWLAIKNIQNTNDLLRFIHHILSSLSNDFQKSSQKKKQLSSRLSQFCMWLPSTKYKQIRKFLLFPAECTKTYLTVP
jgi:hypothetical protein